LLTAPDFYICAILQKISVISDKKRVNKVHSNNIMRKNKGG
jgi:hypothetical protein